jgi:hypothetical protein
MLRSAGTCETTCSRFSNSIERTFAKTVPKPALDGADRSCSAMIIGNEDFEMHAEISGVLQSAE